MLHTKSIADTCTNTQKVSLILLVAVPVLHYEQPCYSYTLHEEYYLFRILHVYVNYLFALHDNASVLV